MEKNDIDTDGVLYSVLILGCNRGLGLELVRFLLGLKKPPKYLFATCHDQDTCSALHAYNLLWNPRKTKVKVLKLEVNDDREIANVVTFIEQELDGVGLSVLINNAETHIRKDLETVSWDDMRRTFETNTISPIIIARAFRSILSSFVLLGSNEAMSIKCCAAIVNINSVLGSITLNKEGGMYPYRASKTALNMATRCLSRDLKDNGITVISLHPRNIPNESEGPLPYSFTASHIIKFISSLNVTHTGGFYTYDGTLIQF
ncbi:uncharacterized protein LOC114518084 [Dendronephthya gigantea]|uniref:uncharacterized protein LOC114518084 n=1 Tax=Dendronephthya gigantea TaxID=151771 RepID=UPI00106A58BC|nr:uncharacterized protein LOC114518084 [Dendronephthya gigantea]